MKLTSYADYTGMAQGGTVDYYEQFGLKTPPQKSSDFTELKRGLDSVEGVDIETLVRRCKFIRNNKQRVFFIGNGGSAAIASHMAADWAKNGRFSALSFNDPAALTCFANDLGYAEVFTHQLKLHARAGYLLFAISSSGQSANIRTAVMWAREHGVYTVTLSGFKHDNPLRQLGSDNIYVPSSSYGVVEITHLACLHAVLDRLT